MVVLSQPTLDHFSAIKTLRPNQASFAGIPVVDLSDPGAGSAIVRACEELGFFKVVNHGISMDSISELESQAQSFFSQSQSEKDKFGPPDPFGYGSKRIGPNGDVGWIEFLLFNTNPENTAGKIPEILRDGVEKYVAAVKKMAVEITELMAAGLGLERREEISRYLRDEKSDSIFRLNHYPACSELEALSGRNMIGFGEHTDPQIISVLRSNNTSGLQINLRDASWVSVPSDHSSFFINVGDSLQVMTNGRFKSLKHRVLTDPMKSRLSMVFFGGPPLCEKIAPFSSLLEQGEESLYKEFTWYEYKKSAYKSRLADNRLVLFEKSSLINS